VTEHAYPNSSAYVQYLVRRERSEAQLRELLIDGENSGMGLSYSADTFLAELDAVRDHRRPAT
jgi:Arc/MetJ-type ribon-helix-helix transcriptional regulator